MKFKVDENYMWVATHGKELERYPGRWVAIDRARLIAAADTLKELEQMPEVKNARHPLYHFVPEEGDVIYIF